MKKKILIEFTLVMILVGCTPAAPSAQPLQAASSTPIQSLSPSSTSLPSPNPAETLSPTAAPSNNSLLLSSPDGQWTASLDREAGRLELEDPQGVKRTVFPPGSTVQNVSWSPDSSGLVVALSQPPQMGVAEIWMVPVTGDKFSEPRLIRAPGPSDADAGQWISFGAWSPDGSRLLFWVGPLGASVAADGLPLWALQVEMGEVTQLSVAALLNPAYQSWAPDGSALVFTEGGYRSAQVNKWLSLYEVGSGQVRSLLARSEFIPGALAWLPVGDTIAFAAVRESQTGEEWADRMDWDNPAIQARRIYLLDPKNGEYHRLNAIEVYQDSPRWSSDGGKLYYVQMEGDQAALMAADPATGEAQPLPGCQAPLPTEAGYYGQVDWSALYEGCPAVSAPSPGAIVVAGQKPAAGCSAVERLSPDSPEAQQIVEEFVKNYRAQQPTEYMGMAILHRVDRLGEWAVVQGSVSGEARDVIAVHLTSLGYQLAERYIITAPLESFDEPEKLVPQYFLQKLPEAPVALFTCLDQSWLLGRALETGPLPVYQLSYVGTGDTTTKGVAEIITLQTDGSNRATILSEPMLIQGLVSSPDGERIAFTGCPGSLSTDCSVGEDQDVWVVNWDGSNLRNLTEDSAGTDSHPDWSPDGEQITFDSDRSGNPQLYIMDSAGGNPRALTDGSGQNTEPKWSPDGKWIAYHWLLGGETQICVVSPDGHSAGDPISGTMPAWSPARLQSGVRLAFLCFQGGHSDICTARPDGSELANLTNSPADEHSPAWSPDGIWLAFVSNRGDDVDLYKVCATCPDEPTWVRLTDEPRAAGWPAWSPDGSRVVYVAGEDLMLVNADRSGATYLASDVFGPPIWRP